METEIELENIESLELDDTWIDELEKEDLPYNNFYNEIVTYFNIFYVYINNENDIYNIKKETVDISNNTFEKERLVKNIKKYRINNNTKHNLISILQYNIDLQPDDIKFFISKRDDYNFLSIKKNLNDIIWKDTINYFKDINSLYIFFYQERKKNGKQTKKIFIKNYKTKKKGTRKKAYN